MHLKISRFVFLFFGTAVLFAALPGMGCGRAQPQNSGQTSATAKQEIVASAKVETPDWPVYDETRSVSDSIVIGLDADMTAVAALSGEAIRRGIVLAIDEINAKGGILGRPLELIIRDHRGNPERGIDNILEFVRMKDVAAVVGGLHTPVALRELDVLHENEMIYLGPWAAGTPIVENGRTPNFVFRVSVRDEYAGGFLVKSALDRGFDKIGLMLERTGWGRSNEKAMLEAIEELDAECVGVEWFNLGEHEMESYTQRFNAAGAQVVLLVCNPLEGSWFVKSMASQDEPDRIPIVSHWGITGGSFFELARGELPKVDLSVLQTHSFIQPRYPNRSNKVYEAYAGKFAGCQSPRDVVAPVGTAHAYELVNMLAAAINRVGTIDRNTIRRSLEADEKYTGLIRDYVRPFRPQHHDALTAEDFVLARYANDGAIVPIQTTPSN